jgi:hypothetical protein
VVQAPAATNKFCIYKNGVLPRYESLETDINSLIEAFRYPTPYNEEKALHIKRSTQKFSVEQNLAFSAYFVYQEYYLQRVEKSNPKPGTKADLMKQKMMAAVDLQKKLKDLADGYWLRDDFDGVHAAMELGKMLTKYTECMMLQALANADE